MFLNNIMSIRLKKMVYQTRPANKLKLNPNMKNEKEPDTHTSLTLGAIFIVL